MSALKAGIPDAGTKVRCAMCNEAVESGEVCKCGKVNRRRFREGTNAPGGNRRAK